ncbi:MAG: protein phosphatase 2C domain-containing protein [Acidimicrobiales bacterium]|nr:protein phosphatase 2C domain-containing protein [Acidimicrobiales bacterium]
MGDSPPVFGRPSEASIREPMLRARGGAATAAVRAEGASTGWWTLRAASVVGVRHRLAGQAADDSFAWAHDGSRVAVAVADGIGSVSGAGRAAERAAVAAVESALRARPEDAVAAANEAAKGGGATTLVLAVLTGAGQADLVRVGDSSAFVVEAEGAWRELFPPPDEERSGTDTAALPSPEPPVEAASVGLSGGAVLVLATDGVTDPWRDGPTTVAPALVAGILGRPAPLELAALADFSRHGCHDDRTILCVWGRPEGPAR